MFIRTHNETGRVVLSDLARPPQISGWTVREVTPESQSILDLGGPFKWEDGALIKVAVSLDDVKAKKKEKIAAVRYDQEMGGFQLSPHQGGLFVRTDARTRTLLNGAALRASADPAYVVLNWKTAEGTFITLSNAMILTLNGTVEQFIAGCFAKEKALCDSIDSATTIEEVNSIQW